MKETFPAQTDGNISSLVAVTDRLGKRESRIEPVNRSLLPGIFLRELESAVLIRAGRDDTILNSNLRSRLVQFWFGGDRTIHYEVWIHGRTAQMELGLHFEAAQSRNRKLYQRFERELLSIHAALGSSIWLEGWERGWSRIYETQPLWPLDSARVATIADRMAEIIAMFQPILDA